MSPAEPRRSASHTTRRQRSRHARIMATCCRGHAWRPSGGCSSRTAHLSRYPCCIISSRRRYLQARRFSLPAGQGTPSRLASSLSPQRSPALVACTPQVTRETPVEGEILQIKVCVAARMPCSVTPPPAACALGRACAALLPPPPPRDSRCPAPAGLSALQAEAEEWGG